VTTHTIDLGDDVLLEVPALAADEAGHEPDDSV